MSTVALRTALIWRDEVMDDLVLEKPTKVTVGNNGTPTFVVPDIGLPKGFAIVRPGNRGYLLTLGDKMGGTICLDGKQTDVGEFVQRGGDAGFRATPISGRDWGVVELDGSGDYKLFFQFVPVEDAVPFFTRPVLFAGLGGYVISLIVLAAIFFLRGVKTDFTLFGSDALARIAEAAFRGGVITTAALGLGGIVFWITRQDGESQASLGFSIILHAALLFMTYQLYDGSNPFVWPGPRSLTGNYLVTRLEEPKPEPKAVASTVAKEQTAAAATPKEKPAATKNDEGQSGGQGKTERKRDPNSKGPPNPPKVALLDDKNSKIIEQAIQHDLSTNLNKFMAMPGEKRNGELGFGVGTGTGVGDGKNGTGTTRGSNKGGTGGGGFSDADMVSAKGPVNTGKLRPGGGNCATPPCGTGPKEIKVSVGEAEGDLEGLTAEEINRVVKARAGVFRACYQKELNRIPGLGGKLVMHFQIGGDGVVKSAKTASTSALHNEGVESCVNRQIMGLKFPAKGGLSNVNYPFVFQPGG